MTPHLLLLRLSRLALTDEDRVFVELHAKDADWHAVFRLAQRGGIAGLVARHLEGVLVPADVRHSFLAVALQTRAHNELLMAEARRLCRAAEMEGLVLVPLKGAALNLGLPYDDLSLRAMCDLDLLTRRNQLGQLGAFLRREGYEEFGDRVYYLRYSHHLHYRKRLSGERFISLELHWTALRALFARPVFDEGVLRRMVVASYQGESFRVLHPDDFMLSLLLHLADHRFRAQLKWAVDIAEVALAAQGSLNWAAIYRRAQEMGVLRVVSYATDLVRLLLQAPIPESPSHGPLPRILRALSTPEDLIESRADQRARDRLLFNLLLLNFDSVRAGLSYLLHFKGTELYQRYSGRHAPAWIAPKTPFDEGS